MNTVSALASKLTRNRNRKLKQPSQLFVHIGHFTGIGIMTELLLEW